MFTHLTFRIIKKCTFTFFLLTAFNLTYAQSPNQISYTPNDGGALILGQGLDIFNISQGAGVAFDNISDPSTQDATVKNGQSQVYITAISNESQLKKSLGISASLNLSFGSTDISASFNQLNSSIFNSNSIVIAVTAEVDYGVQNLRKEKLHLSSDASDLKKAKDWNGFYTQFGHHYISAVNRKQLVTIFLTVDGVSESTKEEFNAKFGIKTSYLFFKGSAEASINSLLSSSSSNNHLSYHSYYLGKGHDFSEDTKLLENLGKGSDVSLSNIVNLVNSYLSKLSPDNAVITDYFLSSYSDIGLPADENYIMNSPKFLETAALFENLHNISIVNDEINSFTKNTNFYKYAPLTEKTMVRSRAVEIKAVIDNFEANLKNFINCKALGTCNYSSIFNVSQKINNEVSFDAFQDEANDLLSDLFNKYSLPPYSNLNSDYSYATNGQLLSIMGAAPAFARPGIAPIRIFHQKKFKILSNTYDKIANGIKTLNFDIEILRPSFFPSYNQFGQIINITREDWDNTYNLNLIFNPKQTTEATPTNDLNNIPIFSNYTYQRVPVNNRPFQDEYTRLQNQGARTYDPNIPADFMFYDKVHFTTNIDLQNLNNIDNILLSIANITPPKAGLPINTPYLFIKSYSLKIN